jgi:hypothetical protein
MKHLVALALPILLAPSCKKQEDPAPRPAVLIPPDARGTFDREQTGYPKVFTYADKIAAFDPGKSIDDQLHVLEGERVGESGYRAKRLVVVRWEKENRHWVLIERCSGTVTFDERSHLDIALAGSDKCTAWNGSYNRVRNTIGGHPRPVTTAPDFDAGYLPPEACKRYRDCVCTLRLDDPRYGGRCAEIAKAIDAERVDVAACTAKLDGIQKELDEAKTKLPYLCERRDAGANP